MITTNDYVSKVISNINIENRDDIIDLYAKSSEMAITCYSSSEGYVAYGNKKYNPTPEQMMAMFKSTNNELSFKHHNEVLAYGYKEYDQWARVLYLCSKRYQWSKKCNC